MDWSHSEMPFVLSIFLLCCFTLSLLFVLSRELSFYYFSYGRKKRKSIFLYFGCEQPRMKIDHGAEDKQINKTIFERNTRNPTC